MLETHAEISKQFFKLQDKLENTVITIHTSPTWNIPKINENSTLGEQIKYYRKLKNIKQSDLSLKLGYKRGVLDHLENRELKLINIDLIKAVIKELDIEGKIIINDDYLAFLLDNPSKTILDFKKKNHLTRLDLAKMIETDSSVIKKWENGEAQMTRASYNKLKKL